MVTKSALLAWSNREASLRFWVPSKPVPQPRVKASHHGGFTRVYDPGDAKFWKRDVVQAAHSAIVDNTWRCIDPQIPALVKLDFFFVLPSHPYAHAPTYVGYPAYALLRATPPDIDNVVKSTLDAMKGLPIWCDDGIVSLGHALKWIHPQHSGALIEIIAAPHDQVERPDLSELLEPAKGGADG